MKIKDEIIKSIIDIQGRHKNLVDKLNDIYKLLNITNQHLMKYKNELDNMDDNKLENRHQLYNVLLKYESDIKKLNNDTKPYLEEMESIKKTSTVLYLKIKELFPNVDEEILKDKLAENIERYKNDNKID